MIANVVPLNSGFALTDPADPRCLYLCRVRERFGHFLHNSSESLRQQGEENTVDAVQMLVSNFFVFGFIDCSLPTGDIHRNLHDGVW